MINYEQKAEIFTRALAASGGDVAEALRQMDRETRPRSKRAEATRREAHRLRREEGLTLANIAKQLNITEGYASTLCRGVPLPPPASPGPHALGEAIRDEIGARLGLEPGWLEPRGRGRTAPAVAVGRMAAMVAMREAGLTLGEIAQLLSRDRAFVVLGIRRGRADLEARPLAMAVLQSVRAGGGAAVEGRAA